MTPVKLIAFHLTQFHPIPENDQWWGEGFTEWTNVVRGQPFYPDHWQPQLPTQLGFYDLRHEDARKAQAELARRFGVDGFCYYYYWFAGKRLLETPVEAMLAGGQPMLPFCLCWANENWTRRWDGKDQEILISQQHSPDDDIAIIRDLIRHFRDPRYMRIRGHPLMLVYRISLLPEPRETVRRWREECRASGIGEIFLCAVQHVGMPDPAALGFDATVSFPPHGCVGAQIDRGMADLSPAFSGRVFDYLDVIRDAVSRRSRQFPNFRGVMPSWDNTARKGTRAHIFHGATPIRYRSWLAEAIRATSDDGSLPEPIVFINAWNEWAEGCHLEPDNLYGTAWLDATLAARADAQAGARLWSKYGMRVPALPASEERRLAGAPLDILLAELPAFPTTSYRATRLELLLAAVRRFVERRCLENRPTLRRAVLPIAKYFGFAD